MKTIILTKMIVELASNTLFHFYGAIAFGVILLISILRYFYKKDGTTDGSK